MLIESTPIPDANKDAGDVCSTQDERSKHCLVCLITVILAILPELEPIKETPSDLTPLSP